MQSVSNATAHLPTSLLSSSGEPAVEGVSINHLTHYQIIRRNGAVVPFEPNKIAVAMMKAF